MTTLGKPALVTPAFKAVTWHGLWRSAGRYRRFPIFLTWDGLFNTAGLQVPPLMFAAALFSSAAAGLYSLANGVLSLPLSLQELVAGYPLPPPRQPMLAT